MPLLIYAQTAPSCESTTEEEKATEEKTEEETEIFINNGKISKG